MAVGVDAPELDWHSNHEATLSFISRFSLHLRDGRTIGLSHVSDASALHTISLLSRPAIHPHLTPVSSLYITFHPLYNTDHIQFIDFIYDTRIKHCKSIFALLALILTEAPVPPQFSPWSPYFLKWIHPRRNYGTRLPSRPAVTGFQIKWRINHRNLHQSIGKAGHIEQIQNMQNIALGPVTPSTSFQDPCQLVKPARGTD